MQLDSIIERYEVDNGGGAAAGIHLPCGDILCHCHELQRVIIVIVVDAIN